MKDCYFPTSNFSSPLKILDPRFANQSLTLDACPSFLRLIPNLDVSLFWMFSSQNHIAADWVKVKVPKPDNLQYGLDFNGVPYAHEN